MKKYLMKKSGVGTIVKQTIAILLVASLATSMVSAEEIRGHEIPIRYSTGTSTRASGARPIWVRDQFLDVSPSYWFYEGAQRFRKLGVLTGDQYGCVFLRDAASAAEVYTLFVRYIYSTSYDGKDVQGAIHGDYTYMGHTAWLDAYTAVHDKLADTIKLMDHQVALPAGQQDIMTRKEAFVLYCMAALSRCSDPVWYFNQFSSVRLGYYARSNAPIKRYGTDHDVLHCFSVKDQLGMSELQIQCANMLMYLGVLEGDQFGTLAPNETLDRASAVKLLAGIDNVDGSPHVNDQDDGSNDDWGGKPGEFEPPTQTPTPTTTPAPTSTPTPTPEPTPVPTPTPTPTPIPTPEPEHHKMTLIFCNLENEIIGSLVVQSNTDIRAALNDYVRSNLVHPDLRDGDPADVTRDATYRRDDYNSGKYYTCTRYIDYAMIRTPIEKQGSRYVVQPSAGKEYQWSYGWAIGTLSNRENLWSVLGVAELEDWDGSSFSAEGIQVLDPEEGIKVEKSVGEVVLKPIFQPGPLMYYGTADEPADYRFVAASHWYYNSSENYKHALQHGLIAERSAPGRGDLSKQFGDWMALLPVHEMPEWYKQANDIHDDGQSEDVYQGDDLPDLSATQSDPSWKNMYKRDLLFFQTLTFERTHVMPDGSLRGVPYARELVGDGLLYLDMTESFNDYGEVYGSKAEGQWQLFQDGKYNFHHEIKVLQSGDRVSINIQRTPPIHYGVVFLKDAYGANYVTGAHRSAPWRSLNNLNYDFPTKNTLYPAVENIADAKGTYGFIVDGAISYYIEEFENSGDTTKYTLLASKIPLKDINIDTPLLDEIYPNEFSTLRIEAQIEAIDDLITCIYTHNRQNEIDYWDEWLDKPRINYHQLQLYLYDWEQMKFNGGPQAHVKSQEEADATIIPHCKLHYACQNGG